MFTIVDPVKCKTKNEFGLNFKNPRPMLPQLLAHFMHVGVIHCMQQSTRSQEARSRRRWEAGNSPGFARVGDWGSFRPHAYVRTRLLFFGSRINVVHEQVSVGARTNRFCPRNWFLGSFSMAFWRCSKRINLFALYCYTTT
jgi:hypothetical protein